MEEKQEVDVGVTKKGFFFLLGLLSFSFYGIAQEEGDSTKVFKKRVLESTEIDFLTSYYTQDGNNASVTGGIGSEKLTDLTPTIVVSIPLNDDDVLKIDAGISAYSSASSSNLNPFDKGLGDDDDQVNATAPVSGSPWVESSGASRSDLWRSIKLDYSHSSDDRNTIWGAHLSYSSEYDYSSYGFGGSFTKLFNEKNTEFGISGNAYFDSWNAQTPIELRHYSSGALSLNEGILAKSDILDQNGNVVSKNSAAIWKPFKNKLLDTKSRNTYSVSLSFSQILSTRAQMSLFADVIMQSGWLANPMQRVYFADRANYFVGNKAGIANYTTSASKDVFQLADDIERLPDTRLKIPVGGRLNYYINEHFVLRTYYRFYSDDWGINSHTASVELPIKLGDKFTFYPGYRFYNQTAAKYFAGFNEHLSTSKYYTSDYDLSKFTSHQYSFGVKYNDIFTKMHIGKLGLKTIEVKYSYYDRSTGLKASIVTAGLSFVVN